MNIRLATLSAACVLLSSAAAFACDGYSYRAPVQQHYSSYTPTYSSQYHSTPRYRTNSYSGHSYNTFIPQAASPRISARPSFSTPSTNFAPQTVPGRINPGPSVNPTPFPTVPPPTSPGNGGTQPTPPQIDGGQIDNSPRAAPLVSGN